MIKYPQFWRVERLEAEKLEQSFSRDVTFYSEWLRLLVGHSLAFAQQRDERWEYLVPGIPAEDLEKRNDSKGLAAARDAVAFDFAILDAAVRSLRGRLETLSLNSSVDPEGYTLVYGVVAMLTLPVDERHWHVTDEGLSIVRWGVKEGGKRLLDWTTEDLEGMRGRLLRRLPDVGGSTGIREPGATSRDPRIENAVKRVHQNAFSTGRTSAAPQRTSAAPQRSAAPARSDAWQPEPPRWLPGLRSLLTSSSWIDWSIVYLLLAGILAFGIAVGFIVGQVITVGRIVVPIVSGSLSQKSGEQSSNPNHTAPDATVKDQPQPRAKGDAPDGSIELPASMNGPSSTSAPGGSMSRHLVRYPTRNHGPFEEVFTLGAAGRDRRSW